MNIYLHSTHTYIYTACTENIMQALSIFGTSNYIYAQSGGRTNLFAPGACVRARVWCRRVADAPRRAAAVTDDMACVQSVYTTRKHAFLSSSISSHCDRRFHSWWCCCYSLFRSHMLACLIYYTIEEKGGEGRGDNVWCLCALGLKYIV